MYDQLQRESQLTKLIMKTLKNCELTLFIHTVYKQNVSNILLFPF